MEYYLKVIKRIFIYNASSLLSFRSSFINSLISSIVWSVSSLISALLLTSKSGSVYGWSRNELILLTGSYTIMWGIVNILFQRNFQDLTMVIDRGKLDSTLLKPIDSQFLVSFKQLNYAAFSRLILGYIIITTIASRVSLHISFLNFIAYLILILLGVTIIYSVWFMILTILIWHHSLNNLNALANNMVGYSRYPQEMFQKVSPSLLVLFPVLITSSIPTRFLLHKARSLELLFLFLASTTTLFLSRKFWQFALRSYTSAGG